MEGPSKMLETGDSYDNNLRRKTLHEQLQESKGT